MNEELEARLEVGMVATIDDARHEKESWKEVEQQFELWMQEGADNYQYYKQYRDKAHTHFLRWQREEELRRKALRAWREYNEG